MSLFKNNGSKELIKKVEALEKDMNVVFENQVFIIEKLNQIISNQKFLLETIQSNNDKNMFVIKNLEKTMENIEKRI